MITVEYILTDLPDTDDIDIEEDRGRVVFKVGRHLTPEQIVSGLNRASEAVLAGGHWFQEWKGDIVSMEPTDDPAQRQLPSQRPNLHDVNRPESGAA